MMNLAMSDGPWYTFAIGNAGLGYWLIGKNPNRQGKWYLAMVDHRTEILAFFDSAHEAAYAVAHHRTGNLMWDLSQQWLINPEESDELEILKAWIRHEEYPRPIEPADEDEEGD